ncbi:MAG: hypothetical protein SOY13_05285 [Pseudoflavonifractor sp.]|nr:hypothetical protein [Pseudoflavonifractor sp.]
MHIGEAFTFVPAGHGNEICYTTQKNGKKAAEKSRRVTGYIIYINEAHRYFVVEYKAGLPGREVWIRQGLKFDDYDRKRSRK